MLPLSPFYLHPAEEPAAWRALRDGALGLSAAVVNVHNGPGAAPDPYYLEALAPGCRTPLMGYVPLGYGRRQIATIVRDCQRWRSWYGIDSVMLDETPVEEVEVGWVRMLVATLRAGQFSRIVLNPGRWPGHRVVWIADVTCVVETTWEQYRRLDWPEGCRDDLGAQWHLVHSTPLHLLDEAHRLAARRGAQYAWITDATLPNPWCRLPADWGLTGRGSRACHEAS